MTKYNWLDIQKDHDSGMTWKALREKYGCTMQTLAKAKLRGDFISRSNSEAQKLKPKRVHSEQTKLLLSSKRKEYLKINPDKVPYKLNHYSKRTSYAEKYFIEVFEKEKINLLHHLQVGVYELDFYNQEQKIYLEVDGDQHYLDKRIYESDHKRNQYLFEQGWKGMRIRWSTYQKLSTEQKCMLVKQIQYHLQSNDLVLPCLQII